MHVFQSSIPFGLKNQKSANEIIKYYMNAAIDQIEVLSKFADIDDISYISSQGSNGFRKV